MESPTSKVHRAPSWLPREQVDPALVAAYLKRKEKFINFINVNHYSSFLINFLS